MNTQTELEILCNAQIKLLELKDAILEREVKRKLLMFWQGEYYKEKSK